MKCGDIPVRDVDKNESFAPVASLPSIGCIFLNGENEWHARCGSHEEWLHGTRSFEALDKDVTWLVGPTSDPNYKQLAHEARNVGVTLQRDSWLRQDFRTMAREWGMTTLHESPDGDVMAKVISRTADAVICAINAGGDSHDLSGLQSAPSLSNWIRARSSKDLASNWCGEARLDTELKGVIVRAFRRKLDEVMFLVEARFPPLSHALEIMLPNVPASGAWKVALMDGREPLSEELVSRFEATEVPVVFTGQLKAGKGPVCPYIDSWTRKGHEKRSCYLLEEIREMLPGQTVHNWKACLGEGWREPVMGDRLRRLVADAGGEEVAHVSWSVGLAAENLLCATMRGVRSNEKMPLDSVWAAARNRIRMASVIRKVVETGCAVTSTYVGNLIVHAPNDPETLDKLVQLLWKSGLVLSIDTARRIAETGIALPEAAEDWGGSVLDLPLARIRNRGQANAMWHLDSILDLAPRERADQLKNMMQQDGL